MASVPVEFSYRIKDAVGVPVSFTDYAIFDDAVATLSTLITYMQATSVLLDAMTDGQIIQNGMKIYPALVGGLKSAPAAGSDVEETGLITYNLNGSLARAWGEDIPAIALAVQSGKSINVAAGSGLSWVTHQMNGALAAIPTDDAFVLGFASVRSAQKTFRKHRSALKRA